MNTAETILPGQTTPVKLTARQLQNFWAKIDKNSSPNGCWIWTASRLKNGGYGCVNLNKITARAHRVCWEISNGIIPDGLQALHNCPGGDNPACCNPDHLFIGTQLKNIADMISKGRNCRGEQAHAASIKGEAHFMAKLTAEKVLQIRSEYTGQHGEKIRLSRKFEIGMTQICRILDRESWKHV